jgi:hypothetical protein
MLGHEAHLLTYARQKKIKKEEGEERQYFDEFSDLSGDSSEEKSKKKKDASVIDLTAEDIIQALKKDPKLVEAEITAIQKKSEADAKMALAYEAMANGISNLYTLFAQQVKPTQKEM